MKYLLILIFLAAVLFTAGCTGGDQEPAVTPTLNIIHVTLSQTPAATPSPQVVYETVTITPVPTAMAAGTGQDSFRTYTSNEYKFSIQYPGCWTVSGEYITVAGTGGKKYLVYFDDPTFTSKQEITINPESAGMTLDDWTNVFLTQVKTNPTVSVVSQDPVQVDGVPAKKIVLTNGEGQDAIESTIILVIQGNNSYFMEFTSRKDHYPVYAQEADSMIQTFRFL